MRALRSRSTPLHKFTQTPAPAVVLVLRSSGRGIAGGGGTGGRGCRQLRVDHFRLQVRPAQFLGRPQGTRLQVTAYLNLQPPLPGQLPRADKPEPDVRKTGENENECPRLE